MNTATLPVASPTPTAHAHPDRLAWLFRAGQADGRPHPLLQPVACLRGAADAIGAMPTPPPARVAARMQPRHTVDRAWLRDRVAMLPALPQALTEALRVLQRDDSSSADCAEALARDPALAAQVLRMANAAVYGRSGRIASMQDAVGMLGRHTLGTVLTAAVVAGQFDQAACPGFDLRQFWREAFACGIAAQALAVELGADGGLAFTAGLMHDLGSLVLAVHLPGAQAEAMAWARLHDQPLHQAEHEVLGIDHAEAGALIARHWRFPPAVVAAIAGHHGAGAAPAEPGQVSLTDLVQAGDAVAHALDLHQADDERVPALCPQLAQRLQLTPERCARLLATTEQGVQAVTQTLAL